MVGLRDVADFGRGAGKGVVGGVVSAIGGVVDSVKLGHALLTDARARQNAYHTAEALAGNLAGYGGRALSDPSLLLRDAKSMALKAQKSFETFRETASPEDYGKLLGGGAFEVGAALLPVTKISKIASATKIVGKIKEAANTARRFGDVADESVLKCAAAQIAKGNSVEQSVSENIAIWHLDEKGKPVAVEATLEKLLGGARSKEERALQLEVGKGSEVVGDEGGHLIGHRFMGDQGLKNLFPQNSNLNRGPFKTLENEWADWIEGGYKVDLKILLDPPGSDRPNKIHVQYNVIDPDTGKIIHSDNPKFENKYGENYDRVKRKDIQGE